MNEQQRISLLAEAARKALDNSDGAEPVQIVVREGRANDVKEPHGLSITGNIDTPYRFLHKRKNNLLMLEAHIEVNRDAMNIELINDEHSGYEDRVAGQLALSQEIGRAHV